MSLDKVMKMRKLSSAASFSSTSSSNALSCGSLIFSTAALRSASLESAVTELHYVVAGFCTLKSTAYSTGTTPSVNTVPNARPAAMINASE